MRNTRVVLAAMMVALAAIVSAGGLLAVDIGFKLNKQIFGLKPRGSAKVGQTYLALPYLRQSGLNNAKDLAIDIGCGTVNELRRYVEASNAVQVYRCPPNPPGTNFALVAGEGTLVISKAVPDSFYIAVGSHTAAAVFIDGPPKSKIGRNNFAMPYNFTGANAKDLSMDIGCASISEVRRYVSSSNSLQIYRCPPRPAGTNFPLVPGESYDVIAKRGVALPYVPSHD